MKIIKLYSLLLLVVIIGGCKNTDTDITSYEDVDNIIVRIQSTIPDTAGLTRVAVSNKIQPAWEEGDTLGIFPTKGGQLEFPITTGYGTTQASFNGGGWGLKQNFSYASYCPYDYTNRDATKIPLNYIGQVQTGNDNKKHMGKYIYLMCPPQTVGQSLVSFSFQHLGTIFCLKLTMPEAKTYTSLKIFESNKTSIFPVKKTVNLLDNNLQMTNIGYADNLSLKLKDIKTVQPNEEIIIWMTCPTVVDKSKTLKVVVYDNEGWAYVSDIKTQSGNPALVSFRPNTYRILFSSPKLEKGFNFGINDWESEGTDQGGKAY